MHDEERVLLISGSTRSASGNTALLRTGVASSSVPCMLDGGMTALPHFDPDLDGDDPPAAVAALRAAIAESTAVLFSTPEYAGTIPGALKNLLEWTVGSTVLTDKPVAWINCSPDPRRGHGAIANLVTVLGYVGAQLVTDACVAIPVPRESVDADGLVTDPELVAALERTLHALTR